METFEVEPLKNWIPRELEVRELEENEIWIQKEGVEDEDLTSYLNDGTVRILESEQLDRLVLEKRVNQRVNDPLRELAFSVLLDETGSTKEKIAPNIDYARVEDDRVYYGQEFLTDYGPVNDQKIDSMEEAEDVLRTAGIVTGTQSWLNITHGDMIRMYPTGKLRGLPEPKNLLFSDSPKVAMGIDYETAFFDKENRAPSEHKSGLKEMNSESSSQEYDAVRRALQANIVLRHLPDFFDRMTEADIITAKGVNKDLFLRYKEPSGIKSDRYSEIDGKDYRVDLNKLLDVEEELTGETNTVLADHVRRMNEAYEKGFDINAQESNYAISLIREAENYSTIPTQIERQNVNQDPTPEIARMRWEEIHSTLGERLTLDDEV